MTATQPTLNLSTFDGRSIAVLGLGVSLIATRALASLLYGVEPTDPITLLAVASLLAAVAVAASYLPARHATAVDPVRSLRAE